MTRNTLSHHITRKSLSLTTFPYHREQFAVRELERVGGKHSTEWSGPEWIKGGPEWLQKIIYDGWLSWFDRVWSVNLGETAISDEGLKHLGGLTNLLHLSLENTQISDEGLKHLGGLTNLGGLYLHGTQISDEGLKHLSGLTNLTELRLEKHRAVFTV